MHSDTRTMNLKIRHLLLILIGLILLLSLSFITWKSLDLANTSNRVDWLVQANHLTDIVIEANLIQARERGITHIILSKPDSATAEMRVHMLDMRATGDISYRQAVSLARKISKQSPSHPLTSSLQALAKSRGELEQARLIVDRIINQEDISITQASWLDTMNTFINALIMIRHDALAPTDNLGQAYHDNLITKDLLFSISEYAGLERALIGGIIADGRPISHEEMHLLIQYQDTITRMIGQFAHELKESNREAALEIEMHRFNEEYLGHYQRLRNSILLANERHSPYPLDASSWYTEATHAIDSILAVSSAISQQTKRQILAVQKNERISNLFLIGLILTALLIMSFTVILVYRHILLPLRILNQASKQIANGDMQQSITIPGNDEFSELGKSFEQMRISLLNHIDENKQTIEALKTSEGRFDLITNGIQDGIWDLDLASGYLYFSPRWKSMLDYSDEQIEPNFLALQTLIHPDDLGEALKSWLGCMEGETSSFSIEYRLKNRLGDYRWILCRGLALQDEDGTPIRMAGSHTDITERKLQEEQIRRSQKMDALGNLTGGISHDFNNMLSIILGYSEMLHERLKDDPKLGKYVNEIHNAGERAKKLTSKLLAFSRKVKYSEGSTDINTLLLDGQHMLEKTLTARIKLLLDLEEKIWPVWLDKGGLEDVVLNMSINAMHAMPEGGSLTIVTRNMHLGKADTPQLGIKAGDYVSMLLIDTGIGMDKETLNQVFDPFFTTKGDEGTGLGMSQVYGFVQQSRGGINVFSEPGIGTRIMLYFPRHEAQGDTEPRQQKENLSEIPTGHETILVVDDEVALLDLAKDILATHGYNVLCGEDGEQALEILKNESVDMLLSDVIMPGMDGYQLAEETKKLYPHIKIQMVSGFNDESHMDTTSNTLHEQGLQKPLNSGTLLRRVRELLDESQEVPSQTAV